eukprot:403359901
MESVAKTAKVITVDGGEFDVPIDALRVSGYFNDFLEDTDQVSESLDISLFSVVTKSMMASVIEFSILVTQHRAPEISKPIFHQSIYEITSPIFAKFADKYQDDELCQLILVADKLNNQALLELLSAKLAIHIQRMETKEEIRKYFQITQPFNSAEDEERIKDENEEANEIYCLNDDDD